MKSHFFKESLPKNHYSGMILIINSNFCLTIGYILRSSMLVNVQFILDIKDSIVVGVHHLEQELGFAIRDLLISDLLDCLLELPLQRSKVKTELTK